MQLRSVVFALLVGVSSVATHAQAPASKAERAAMETALIPSGGVLMNGIVYVAAGAEPHPTVVLLHGFPGNEQNLDLAQEIRRAGWNVLFFHPRGSWGSPGDYSFTHGIEDTAAAVAFLRDLANAKKYRVDASRIVLLGHSVGGFNAVEAGAADPALLAVGIISAADLGGRIPEHIPALFMGTARKRVADGLASQGMAPLHGCTPESLAQDVLDHADAWRWPAKAKALAAHPFLDVSSDDGNAAADDGLSENIRKAGDEHVTMVHLATDHSYSDKRLELATAVVDWLKSLPAAK